MFLYEEGVFVRLFCFVSGEAVAGGLFCEGALQFFEDFFRPFKNGFWDAGQFCDVDAVAFVGSAGQNLVQKDYLVHPFADSDVAVLDIRK